MRQARSKADTTSRSSPVVAGKGRRGRRCACEWDVSEQDDRKQIRERRLTLQRHPAARTEPVGVRSLIHEALRSAGRPLDPDTRRSMESRFGHDFGQVRIHTGPLAAESARAVSALAFTVGRDIVFVRDRYKPATAAGRRLLAHELVHVVQQQRIQRDPGPDELKVDDVDSELEREARRLTRRSKNLAGRSGVSTVSESLVQRLSIGESIARFFGGGTFTDEELHAYLRFLRERGGIEDENDSDNKAREIAQRFAAGERDFVLTPSIIVLLIKEMQSGFTGDDDERAILELLERSEPDHLRVIFGPGKVDPVELFGDFHTAEEDLLLDFFERRFAGGYRALTRGQVQPQGPAVPVGVALADRGARRPEEQEGPIPGGCDVRRPENCHSYESWIGLFGGLETFQARSSRSYRVIGAEAAPQATATDPTAAPGRRRPFVLHERREFMPHDRFIDGPTDQWVRDNLPPNLVATAYELPSDCADMAVILRHVWLVAHRRTEEYRGWLVGAVLDDPRTRQMRDLLRGGPTHGGAIVWSGSVERIVRPYTGPDGQPIRDFPTLQRLLHPGDVLVWDHPAPRGGHTHTIMNLRRQGGRVVEIGVLQGNEPVGERAARNILIREYGFTEEQVPAGQQAAWPERARDLESAIRSAPGRRIEVGTLSGDNLPHDSTGVWTIWGGSRLVAAGPPTISTRPAARARRSGRDVVQGLRDWLNELRGAGDVRQLQSLIEAALLETRSLFEGGHGSIVSEADARNFGSTAGDRLWALASESARARMRAAERRSTSSRIREADLSAEHLGEESHYRPLHHISRLLQQLGQDARVPEVGRLFGLAEAEFSLAARGTRTVDYQRSRTSLSQSGARPTAQIANVLLSGFDPFEFDASGRQIEPRPGRFNPSGAAILQLDGRTVSVDRNRAAALEGVILPVHFGSFRSGIVESQLGPHLANADAVLTVSEAPGADPTRPVRVERYAVGVHRLNSGRLEAIPPGPGSGPIGPAIIETGPGVPAIVQEASASLPAGQGPTIGEDIRFQFSSAEEADRALRALGLPPQGTSVVEISQAAAIRRVLTTMVRGVQSPGFTFTVGRQSFQAVVLSGPGGSFLSNEVSYRVLRFLAERGRDTTSFHVHTPRGTTARQGSIPQDVTGTAAARRQAQAQGRQVPTTSELTAAREAARTERFRAIETGRQVVGRVVNALVELVKAVVRRLP